MNKTEYLNSLRSLLTHLPKEELDKAMEYYEEYFADAGTENEAQAIEDLGTPQTAAESIITTLVINNAKEPVSNIKKGVHAVWIGFLAIFAIPVGLPFALAFVVLLVSLVLIVFILLLSCYLVAISLLSVGILLALFSFFGISYGFPVFLTILGTGMAFIGLGLLIFIGSIYLSKKFLSWFTHLFSKLVKKGGKKHA